MRQLALAGAARVLPQVIAIGTNPDSEPRDVIAAFRVLCEFGLGHQLEVEDITPTERPTYDELVADLTERLPKVLPLLPLEQLDLARIFADRQRMADAIAARTGVASVGETRE